MKELNDYPYNNTGITFVSDVQSIYDREEIILYDKETEILLNKNNAFLSMTGKRNEVAPDVTENEKIGPKNRTDDIKNDEYDRKNKGKSAD